MATKEPGEASRSHLELTANLYLELRPVVRRALARYGVREDDLGDLGHEVFLVLHRRISDGAEFEYMERWLTGVCRKVAANYRRRALRRRPPEQWAAAHPEELPSGEDPAALEQLELVCSAMRYLDANSADLVALHDAGGIPMATLAKLVGHDRKTIRTRLERARRRLGVLVRDESIEALPEGPMGRPPETTTEGLPPTGVAPPLSEWELAYCDSDFKVARLGNVVLSVWRGQITVGNLDVLMQVGPGLLQRSGGQAVFLAIVEPAARPPAFAARRHLVEVLTLFGPRLLHFVTALMDSKQAWLAEPIMNGLQLLTGRRASLRFFQGIPAATQWIASTCGRLPGGRMPPERIAQAVSVTRASEPHPSIRAGRRA